LPGSAAVQKPETSEMVRPERQLTGAATHSLRNRRNALVPLVTKVAPDRTGHGGLIIKVRLTKKNLIENEIIRDTPPSKL
jgi:hypothetical protein